MKILRPNQPDYVVDRIKDDKHYMLLVSAGHLESDSRQNPTENIVFKWFDYPEEFELLNENDCTPDLKKIVRIAYDNNYRNL